jgi:hypothetical protein
VRDFGLGGDDAFQGGAEDFADCGDINWLCLLAFLIIVICGTGDRTLHVAGWLLAGLNLLQLNRG